MFRIRNSDNNCFSFYPEKIIPFHSNISKLISKDYFNKLNDSNIKEITMTNYKNILTGECHARQTLTKYDPSNSSYHTYKYWVEKCTGNDAFLYDFKLINDGTSLAFYSFNIPSDLEDSIKDLVHDIKTEDDGILSIEIRDMNGNLF